MATGTIKKLVRDRGFGFIEVPGQNDVFFHASDVRGVPYDELREGERVEFEVTEDPRRKGPRAVDVHPAGGERRVA